MTDAPTDRGADRLADRLADVAADRGEEHDDTGHAELAGRLRLSVTRLARQLRQTADSELSPTQASILATVSNHGPLTLGELAEHERVASPTITKSIGLLHDKGLVDKVTDPEDRRFVRVSLTPAGQTLLERTRARKTAWLTRQLEQLAPRELAALDAATEVLEHLTRPAAGRQARPGP